MNKLATVTSFPDSTAKQAQQALTLQEQLPLLTRSIQQLQESRPQPLSPEQIAQVVRPLLVEQANCLDGQNKLRHAQLIKQNQQHRQQQSEDSQELKFWIVACGVGLSLCIIVLLGLAYYQIKNAQNTSRYLTQNATSYQQLQQPRDTQYKTRGR